MTTPSAITKTNATKTKALCVATRCTSVDQFVATFYRFCGDDQTFFVATTTSRPLGLETAFSIQLADKQPVLRGLCVVLDTWATADNRYKRPGIRLGIKRLTADSQLVFDRLRAAARAPDALPEATPPPGPAPVAAVTPATATATATPGPMLPPLTGPRLGLPMTRAATAPAAGAVPAPSTPGVASAPTPPPLPKLSPAKPALAAIPSIVPKAAKPTRSDTNHGEERRKVALTPPPVAVRRFQVALNVDTIPPPITEDDFNQQQLLRRQKTAQPAIASDPLPSDAPVDPGNPAVIVDRPPEAALAPTPIDAAAPAAIPSQDTAPNHAATETRTPGSSLVLPANPLHNLSDESLEGFVDCTLYEETGNFSPADGDVWNDELADPPAAPLSTVAPAITLPAMPFDQPPELHVRTSGDNESLRVAPEPIALPASANRSPTTPGPLSSTDALFAPLHDRASTGAPWLETAGAAYAPEPSYTPGSQDPVARELPEAAPPPPALTVPHLPLTGPLAIDPNYGAVSYTIPSYEPPRPPTAYPPAGYAPFPGSLPIALPPPPLSRPAWQRALLIASTVAVAIVIAFMIARHVRGPAEPAPVPTAAPAIAPHHSSQPRFAAHAIASDGPEAAHASELRGAAGSAHAAAGSAIAAAVGSAAADDEAAGAAPIAGSGPCQLVVATTPAGSIVRLDDQAMGPSPLTIASSCARHKVDVSHPRYQNVSRAVTLSADQPQQLDIALPRPIHSVTVTSTPAGAELSIDGHRAGATPTIVQMMGFATVNLTFSKPGFHSVTKRVYSKLAQDRVSVKLDAAR